MAPLRRRERSVSILRINELMEEVPFRSRIDSGSPRAVGKARTASPVLDEDTGKDDSRSQQPRAISPAVAAHPQPMVALRALIYLSLALAARRSVSGMTWLDGLVHQCNVKDGR